MFASVIASHWFTWAARPPQHAPRVFPAVCDVSTSSAVVRISREAFVGDADVRTRTRMHGIEFCKSCSPTCTQKLAVRPELFGTSGHYYIKKTIYIHTLKFIWINYISVIYKELDHENQWIKIKVFERCIRSVDRSACLSPTLIPEHESEEKTDKMHIKKTKNVKM